MGIRGVTRSIPAVGNSSWYPVETMKQDDFVFRIQLGPTLDQGQTAQLLQLLKWAHGTHTHTSQTEQGYAQRQNNKLYKVYLPHPAFDDALNRRVLGHSCKRCQSSYKNHTQGFAQIGSQGQALSGGSFTCSPPKACWVMQAQRTLNSNATACRRIESFPM